MTGFHSTLRPEEEAIARARIHARRLGRKLAEHLIDRQLYAELQQFLNEVGAEACDAMENLAGSADVELRERLHILLGLGLSQPESGEL